MLNIEIANGNPDIIYKICESLKGSPGFKNNEILVYGEDNQSYGLIIGESLKENIDLRLLVTIEEL